MGLEELGIPCVSIVQEGFIADAQATAGAYCFPNPALAITPHVFTSLTPPLTRKAVDDIIGEIINGLVNPLPESKEIVVERMTTRGPREEVIEFRGKDYRECFDQLNEDFLDWGWSDGFPIIPPTEEAVKEMLKGATRAAEDTVVEKFVPGMARATVQNIAINAVMSGCRPEFLPAVLGAVEAMHHPAINLRTVTMSTGAHAPLFIFNGPISRKLGINSGLCALGPAGPEKLSFANVVIGRAVRLTLMNVGNCYPGIMDQDTIGSPNKFSMVLAENEKSNPWVSFHVEKGFQPEESTVTCFYGTSLLEMRDLESDTAEGLMNGFARCLTGLGNLSSNMRGIHYRAMILLAPDHARIPAREGWTKDDIRKYLYHHCAISAEQYRRSSLRPVEEKWIEAADSKTPVPLYEKPEHIEIVVVGGMAGKSAAYCSGYAAVPHLLKS